MKLKNNEIKSALSILFAVILFHSSAFAFPNVKNRCLQVGEKITTISSDMKKIFGGDTGTFLRESFEEKDYRGISSCLEIPSRPNAAELEKIFEVNRYTQKPNQTPYSYLGVNINKVMYEAGVYYEPNLFKYQKPSTTPKASKPYFFPAPGFRLFTAGFFKKKIRYYRSLTFFPGDRVCLSLFIHPQTHNLTFKVLKNVSRRNGVPLKNDVIITEYTSPKNIKSIQFKRVTGIAIRQTEKDVQPGANGGMSGQRYLKMLYEKVYASVEWTNPVLYDRYFSSIPIKDSRYELAPTQGSGCSYTTAWPGTGFRLTNTASNGLKIEMIPQSSKFYE